MFTFSAFFFKWSILLTLEVKFSKLIYHWGGENINCPHWLCNECTYERLGLASYLIMPRFKAVPKHLYPLCPPLHPPKNRTFRTKAAGTSSQGQSNMVRNNGRSAWVILLLDGHNHSRYEGHRSHFIIFLFKKVLKKSSLKINGVFFPLVACSKKIFPHAGTGYSIITTDLKESSQCMSQCTIIAIR